MNSIHELPPVLRGSAEEQLTQLRDYLARLARRQGEEEDAPPQSRGGVRPQAAQSAEEARRQSDALRSLIVKTAGRLEAIGEGALRLEIGAEDGAATAHVYRSERELNAAEVAALGSVVWLAEDGTAEGTGLSPGLSADRPRRAQLEAPGETLTGELLSFTEERGRPVRSLRVAFSPQQDLHGYSAPWAPGGGKNKWDDAARVARQTTANGVATTGYALSGHDVSITKNIANNGRVMFGAQYLDAGTYTVSFNAALYNVTDETRRNIGYSVRNMDTLTDVKAITYIFGITNGNRYKFTFTLSEGGNIAISLQPQRGTSGTAVLGCIQLEAGSTATAWEPCANVCPIAGRTGAAAVLSPTQDAQDGRTFAADWSDSPGTLCGGSIDLVRGVLTQTHGVIASYNGETLSEPWLSSLDAYAPGATPTTGAQVVYPLSEPLVYSLARQSLDTLEGENNLWSSAGELTLGTAQVLARGSYSPAQRLHIRYSDDGESFTANGGQVVGAWIGTLTDYKEEASAVFSDYTWRRFADDRELSGRLDTVESSVGALDYSMRTDYLARSDFGTYAQQVTADIEANARAITENYRYAELVSAAAAAGVRGELTQYMTLIDGQIRRGYLTDPDTNETVIGIAVSQKLQFTGNRQTVDGEVCWELDGAQTFGLYTATGWQFWVGGRKIGWFDSTDGMLHVRRMVAEAELKLGADWLVTGEGGFGVRYIGG